VDHPSTPEAQSTARGRVRRRRLLAFGGALLVALCIVVLALALSSTTHHVKVVRVVTASTAAVAPHPTLPTSADGGGAPLAPDPRAAGAAAASAAGTAGADGSSSAGQSALASGAASSFARLRSSLPGRVELAVAPLGAGSTTVLGGDVAAHGWSTTKVPVLVALMRARGARGLTAQEQTWARSAITESDNQSILDLFGDLERLKGGLIGASVYIEGLLRLSGDEQTEVATAPPPPGAVTTFGQTRWSPGNAVKFFSALARGCLLSSTRTRYVLGLMEEIVPSESWGLGSAGFSSVAFKGGWGPEASGAYLVRQSGIVDPGSSRGVAVSLVAFPGSGSFSTGTEILTRTSAWLRGQLRLTPRSAVGCAGD
jgi:hypothetical protein